MRNHLIIIFSIFILLFYYSVSYTYAQKDPISFGKVDIADLQMKSYPADTSAPAVILCNYGDYQSTNYKHYIRIKIFKKEGLSWGNYILNGYSKSDIIGVTYNLEGGEIVKSKLRNESIFRERIYDDYYRIKVAMPNVKEGSIIEIKVSEYAIPVEWLFQDEIPVKWSELRLLKSKSNDYRMNYYGYIPLFVNSEERWVAKDVPAFKPEPFINSSTNYITKFNIEKLRFGYANVTTDWDALNRRLLEVPELSGKMSTPSLLNNIADDIEAKYTSKEDKLKAAYDTIKKVIKWNEKCRFFLTSNTLTYALNLKTGNSADVNLTLLQLLKKLKFEAYPIVLSTRENGVLIKITPSYHRLNYVIIGVKENDKYILLDATEELLPMNILPKRVINGEGRIVDSNLSGWVDLSTKKKDKEITQGNLVIGSDNCITGTITHNYIEYAAFDFRTYYGKFNGRDEFLKDLESKHLGLQINNYTIKDLDSIFKPVTVEFDVKIKNKINSENNLLYLNPMLLEKLDQNPFVLNERNYPVDFAYPIEKIYILSLKIPEGFVVDQIPKPLAIKLPSNAGSCIYDISNFDNIIQLSYRFQLNKTMFLPAEYNQLKAFYDEIVKKQSEFIVFKKS